MVTCIIVDMGKLTKGTIRKILNNIHLIQKQRDNQMDIWPASWNDSKQANCLAAVKMKFS